MVIENKTIFATGRECSEMNALPLWTRIQIAIKLIFAKL